MVHPGNSEWWARLARGRWAEGEPTGAKRAKSGSSLESTVYNALHMSKWPSLSC